MIKSVISYLRNWKNILTHGLIGVGILLVAAYVPVSIYIKIGIMISIITFNIIRMKYFDKKK